LGLVKLPYTDNDDANLLNERDPLALLIGLLLDQQIKIEQAFMGPLLLSQRLGGHLDAAKIAAMDEGELIEIFQVKPALHRFPANMAKRTQALCAYLSAEYDNSPERLWTEAADGADLERRLLALPGFGAGKVGTLIAILGKRLGTAPPGWDTAAPGHMTLADVDTFEDIVVYREHKRSMKRS
jgi:uncharacterized HhH-GPD family protein